jgi:leucine-rich PPR motif-containing protein
LELERIIAGRARSGSLGLDDALKLFDELLSHARPASVAAFNHLLAAVSRASGRRSSTSDSGLVVSLFNRMIRECSPKVTPDLRTYSASSAVSAAWAAWSMALRPLVSSLRQAGL